MCFTSLVKSLNVETRPTLPARKVKIMSRNAQVICPKCNKLFKSERNLRVHLVKKIPCDRKLQCVKCNKIFLNKNSYNKHLQRKTPCEFILGNTQTPIKNANTCRFCYREFKSKYSLDRHFRTCKIRNGNMSILFNKIEEDRKLIDSLRKKTYSMEKVLNQNIYVQANINLQFNMGSFFEKSIEKKLLNFGDLNSGNIIEDIIDEEEETIRKIIQSPPRGNPGECAKRIGNLIKIIYRNPQHPQLQNVFTVGAEKYMDNRKEPIRAFLWNKDKWNAAEWVKVREYLIKQVYTYLPSLRGDKLKIIKKIKNACCQIKSTPKLINDFFEEYEDTQIDVWIFIAISLDQKGLLDMSEINRLLKDEEPPRDTTVSLFSQ